MVEAEAVRVALMSIRPEFAYAILSGEKTVEFRRRPIRASVTHVLVYATSPVKAIVGWFAVDGIAVRRPAELWAEHGQSGAIDRHRFDLYFDGTEQGAAVMVGDVWELPDPVPLRRFGLERPPQSYRYLSWSSLERSGIDVSAT